MDESRTQVTNPVDGGSLEMVSVGTGPGVVVVHGGGTDAAVYRRLATRLAASCTVHVYNRRGRGQSAPRPENYGLQTEIQDLNAVLEATGTSRVIGHSVGGFLALAAARELPIHRLALSDPVVNVEGMFPSDFLPEFERLVAAGETKQAMLVVSRGLRNPGSTWPEPIQRLAVSAVLLTPPGRTMARLLPTVPAEDRLAFDADGPASDWATVASETRFYIGEKSPDYYEPIAQALVHAMPHASLEMVPRLGHDAVARAGAGLVKSLSEFLANGR
jgi:pimeloyl-ACP methyl ester carboxylesterase